MQASEVLAENNLQALLDKASQFFEVDFENVRVGEHTLQILQITDIEKYVDMLAEESKEKIELPFWAKIWPASILLSYYITSLDTNEEKKIIELGSGIGIAGLFAAAMGFKVILSDNNPMALLFAKINILKNNLSSAAEVMPVDFTADRLGQTFDYIIGSEIFYKESAYRGLVKFLLAHLDNKQDSEVVLAADYRRQAKKFFQVATKEFHIDQKNIGYKGTDQNADNEKFLCAIYRMKARKK
ncbi:class I SAM-dependent methyltransferase [Desulfonatronovibrio magnus]|uniref:class I SAM-dependent methyltransferase n=1 Tax=Desulfonatronovibrio magnus TaxID=698827 RepID=UPI000ABE055B|nr:protein N-lysine methyltransferase family protein [Desulfonatronovibrio magnus]